jgi:hypothetical protein
MVGFTNNKQLASSAASTPPRPANIVYFVTDDQDQMLGGSFPTTAPGMATPLPKVKIDRYTVDVCLGCEGPSIAAPCNVRFA